MVVLGSVGVIILLLTVIQLHAKNRIPESVALTLSVTILVFAFCSVATFAGARHIAETRNIRFVTITATGDKNPDAHSAGVGISQLLFNNKPVNLEEYIVDGTWLVNGSVINWDGSENVTPQVTFGVPVSVDIRFVFYSNIWGGIIITETDGRTEAIDLYSADDNVSTRAFTVLRSNGIFTSKQLIFVMTALLAELVAVGFICSLVVRRLLLKNV